MKHITTNTYTIKLCLAGPIEVAKQVIREYCLKVGLCVTITPTTYIYTGGEETGYDVGFVNYPRFPADYEKLEDTARELMHLLLDATFQHSALMITPKQTEWISKRENS